MNTIMVQMADEQWTMEAMHLASAMARSLNGQIVLLRLALAHNPGLLGWGLVPPNAQERQQLDEYAAVAEDYGVEFRVQPMQFITLTDALAQATEQLHASVLFARISPSKIPFRTRIQYWNLKRQLHNCRLYTLGKDQLLSVDLATLSAANLVEMTHH